MKLAPIEMPSKRISESDVEKEVKAYAKLNGVYCRKFSSPAKRSVPDDIFLFDTGKVIFIEFKAPGEGPTTAQEREHVKIRNRKGIVYVCDNVEKGKAIIDKYLVWDFK